MTTTTAPHIELKPLTLPDAVALAPLLRASDKEEADILSYGADAALRMACLDIHPKTKSYGVHSSKSGLVSAIGYTKGGLIWSLSRDFDKLSDKAALIRSTPHIVNRFLVESKHPILFNVIGAFNVGAIKWLEHSGCFDIDRSREPPLVIEGRTFYHFRTRSQDEIAAIIQQKAPITEEQEEVFA